MLLALEFKLTLGPNALGELESLFVGLLVAIEVEPQKIIVPLSVRIDVKIERNAATLEFASS